MKPSLVSFLGPAAAYTAGRSTDAAFLHDERIVLQPILKNAKQTYRTFNY